MKAFLILSFAALLWLGSGLAQAAGFIRSETANQQVAQKLDIPVFFAFPKTAYAPMPTQLDTTDKLIDFRHPDSSSSNMPVGYRLYVAGQRAGLAERLAKSGFVQTGDIVLSFRPEWGFTGPYPNVQMGISHAGLAYVANGTVYNIDMPMNAEYMGSLDSKHYQETTVLHVVRPRGLTESQKKNIAGWASRLAARASRAYPGEISFNQDYASPNYAAGKPLNFVKRLGQIALGIPGNGTLGMYCSEFAWSLLSLRNCNPETQGQDFKKAAVPSCVQPIVSPFPMVGNTVDQKTASSRPGLSDGPLMVIEAMGLGEQERDEALREVFESKRPNSRMSAGHRAVAEQMAPFFSKLEGFYLGVFRGGVEAEQIRQGFNAQMKENYSPTSFVINAILPPDHPARVFDYVGSIAFMTE